MRLNERTATNNHRLNKPPLLAECACGCGRKFKPKYTWHIYFETKCRVKSWIKKQTEGLEKEKLKKIEGRLERIERAFRNQMTTQPKPLTAKEVAGFFGISLTTLMAWRKAGIINAVKIMGRVYFTQQEVDRVIKDNRQHFRKPKTAYF